MITLIILAGVLTSEVRPNDEARRIGQVLPMRGFPIGIILSTIFSIRTTRTAQRRLVHTRVATVVVSTLVDSAILSGTLLGSAILFSVIWLPIAHAAGNTDRSRSSLVAAVVSGAGLFAMLLIATAASFGVSRISGDEEDTR